MIKLTRLNGEEIYINSDLIEKIEEKADTMITMNSQMQYVVKEKIIDINNRIISFKKNIFSGGK